MKKYEKVDNFNLKVNVGEIFDIFIYNNLDRITEFDPGNYFLESVDHNFFVINNCRWLRCMEEIGSPVLVVNLKALQTGHSYITGFVQLSQINPLYFQINYHVTIV